MMRTTKTKSIVAIGVVLIVISAALYAMAMRFRFRQYQEGCAENMHALGMVMILYQNDHQGRYPDALSDLLEYSVAQAVFVCPASNDVPSNASTPQSIASHWAAGGHESYIYVGKGLTEKTATATTVVLYESMTNHGDGMNVLFGDGHVDWIDATVGKKVITAAAGRLPILLNEKTGVVSTSQPMR